MQEKKHKQQCLGLIQEFFEDDVVPYEICLYVGIVLGRGTSEGHYYFVFCSISSDDSFTVSGSEIKN